MVTSVCVCVSPVCVQEYFASVGGLLTLSDTLSSVVTQCRENPAACKLAAMITRTLSACITDNGKAYTHTFVPFTPNSLRKEVERAAVELLGIRHMYFFK